MQNTDCESRIKWVYYTMQADLDAIVYGETFGTLKTISKAVICDQERVANAKKMTDIVELLHQNGKIDFMNGQFDVLVRLLEQIHIPAKKKVETAAEEIIKCLQEQNNTSESKRLKVEQNNTSESKRLKVGFINTICENVNERKLPQLDYSSSSDDEGYKYDSLPSIHNEVLMRKPKRVKKLLHDGIDVNLPCYGITPLHLATACGSEAICQILIDHGAVQNSIFDEDGKNCLWDLLSRYCGRSGIPLLYYSPLEISVFSGHPNIVEILNNDSLNNDVLVSCARLANRLEQVESLRAIFRCICYRIKQKYADRNPMKMVPAYLAERKSEIMVVIYTPKVNVSEEIDFFGLRIKFQNKKNVSLEAINVTRTKEFKDHKPVQSEITKIQKLISYHSDQLFLDHSNLNIISGCHVKSRNGASSIEFEHCVVLFCYSKGIVPLGEKKFPRKLALQSEDGDIIFPVDVREGYFQQCYGSRTYDFNKTLKMGCSIGVKNTYRSGTIGPFVELPEAESKVGFLTAGHLFSSHSMESTIIVQPSQDDTFDSSMTNKECGRLLKFDQVEDQGFSTAVIEITQRPPTIGAFAITEKSQLSHAGYEESIGWPTFNSGGIGTVEDSIGRTVLKFGSRSGLTVGFLSSITSLKGPGRPIEFFEISSNEISPVSLPGDSGSAIFLKDGHDELYCIGMLFGMTSHMTAIGIKIQDILERLGLKLKQFHDSQLNETGVNMHL